MSNEFACQNEQVIAEQYRFADKVKPLINARYDHKPLAFIHTYGCQQNVSDSEKLKGWLEYIGFDFCDQPDNADLVLFNTCAVREHAEARVFGNIGALKKFEKARPNMLICLCGCMPQQNEVSEKVKKSYPYVDIVFGTGLRHKFPELLYKKLIMDKRVFDNTLDAKIYEGVPVKRDGTFKTWLPIMQGCNNFCTYCVVPYVRGREHSRTPEAVIAEAKELIASGTKEIMLLGQNVNSYGKGEAQGTDFADLLKMVNDLEGDFRIRFMTSHPRDCTEKLLETMRDCQKVCKCLHLPVQSGSDRVLKEMNRHYDTAHYLSLIDKARELMPDIEFTSDIIVGFPGETKEDFEKTLELVKKVKYRALFTFIFSPRRNTPAEKMPDPIPKEEKSAWFTELLRVQEKIAKAHEKTLVGKTVRVLCEEENGGIVSGKDEAGANVSFVGTADMIGNFCDVVIEDVSSGIMGKIKEN